MLSLVSTRRFGSLTAIVKGAKQVIQFDDDANLFDVLQNVGAMSAEGTCGGGVACGKCKIKVVSGNFPAIEEEEADLIEDAPKGTRLACAIALNGDCDGAQFEVL